MPYTAKQHRLFRAIEHGWQPPSGSGIRISRGDAARMAAEGVKRGSRARKVGAALKRLK